jgi:hypothetical protein
MTGDDRHRFAVPHATGEFDGIDLASLDPNDEGDRRVLILAEHPELHRAIEAGLTEIHVQGSTINPALHLAMHEIVANQLWADDPSEVWQTATRLLGSGYERHEVLHTLASVVSDDVYRSLHDQQAPDPDKTKAALGSLPGLVGASARRTPSPTAREPRRTPRRRPNTKTSPIGPHAHSSSPSHHRSRAGNLSRWRSALPRTSTSEWSSPLRTMSSIALSMSVG